MRNLELPSSLNQKRKSKNRRNTMPSKKALYRLLKANFVVGHGRALKHCLCVHPEAYIRDP